MPAKPAKASGSLATRIRISPFDLEDQTVPLPQPQRLACRFKERKANERARTADLLIKSWRRSF